MNNNKGIFIFLFFLLTAVTCIAQDKANGQRAGAVTDRRWQFHSIIQVGYLTGDAGSAFQIQTINGMQYKSWFGGIGVGIDDYRFRSIPLFFDFRKEFGFSKDFFFIYAGVGMNFMWITDKQKKDYNVNYYGATDFSNGLYYDAGIGYKAKLNNRIAIFVSPGFNHKSTEGKNPVTICPFYGPCYINGNTIKYELNRFSVNAGIIF